MSAFLLSENVSKFRLLMIGSRTRYEPVSVVLSQLTLRTIVLCGNL
jgi:hypothetical protein